MASESKAQNIRAKLQRMKNFGLSPKDALSLWAIEGDALGTGSYLVSKEYANLPPDLKPYYDKAKGRYMYIKNPPGNVYFWNTIDPTCYLSDKQNCKKYNYSTYFISKLEEKLAKMALRRAKLNTKTSFLYDPDSGIGLARIGSDLDALKAAIASGDPAAIATAAVAVAKDGNIKEAVLAQVSDLVPDGPLKDMVVGQVKSQLLSKLPKDTKQYVDKGLSLLNMSGYNYDASHHNTIGYYGSHSMGADSSSSSTYRLTDAEKKIANRIYENTYNLFKPVWALKDKPDQFWPAFFNAIERTEISQQKSPGDATGYIDVRVFSPNGLTFPAGNNQVLGLVPLIRAFAISSLFTNADRFSASDKMREFKFMSKALAAKEAADEAAGKKRQSDLELQEYEAALRRDQEADRARAEADRARAEAERNATAAQAAEDARRRAEAEKKKAEEDAEKAKLVAEDAVTMGDEIEVVEEKSKLVPIALGAVALGGIAYLLYTSKKSKKQYR